MSNQMLKMICILVIVVCLVLIVYSIWNAIATNKRNKAAEASAERIFMAKLEKELDRDEKRITPDPIYQPSYKSTSAPTFKQGLDYDSYEEENVDSQGMKLKDFFQP